MPEQKTSPSERKYDSLLNQMKAFDIPSKVTDEEAQGRKWLRRYHNIMMDVASYIRSKDPKYKSLLSQAKKIERKWNMEGKYTIGGRD
jgi:hypothetical protein